MTGIQHFPPPAGVKAPPFSFAARAGDLLFISGIPGFDDKGALPDGFEAQFGFVVKNIRRVLDEAGSSFADLVKVNVLLTRAADVAAKGITRTHRAAGISLSCPDAFPRHARA